MIVVYRINTKYHVKHIARRTVRGNYTGNVEKYGRAGHATVIRRMGKKTEIITVLRI